MPDLSCSVIIPLYNKAGFITEAIASVQAQTCPAAHIIVVDDGSTDDGANQVAAMHDPRIRLIRQPNAGVSVARNRGIELATGDLVLFLDADDRYLPQFLETIVHLAQRFPEAALVATAYRRFWHDGTIRHNTLPPDLQAKDGLVADFYSAWCQSAFLYTASLAIRRHILADPALRFPPGEKLGEDQDLWFRIAEQYPVAFAPQALVEYRMGVQDSATTGSKVLDILPCYQRIDQRLTAGKIPAHLQQGARRLLASHLLNVARTRLSEGDTQGAWTLVRDIRTRAQPAYRLRTISALCCPVFRSG